MCVDGMRLDKRVMLLGTMMVVLSTVMATQYTTSKARYTFTVEHQSNADIRFIASDISVDGIRVLNADSQNKSLELRLGNWSANKNKTYAAAFGIVNEERFAVNITHVNCSGAGTEYLEIWLHGDRDTQQQDETNTTVCLYSKGNSSYDSTTTAWILGPGDGNARTMRANASVNGDDILTLWDPHSEVRYSTEDTKNAHSASATATGGPCIPEYSSDFVWVQISLDLPNTPTSGDMVSLIHFHFEATTFWTDVTQPS